MITPKKPSSKLERVREFVRSSGVRRSWTVCLTSESEALNLIDDVLEGDHDPRTDFEEAFAAFQHHFTSYVSHVEESRAEYDREFT